MQHFQRLNDILRVCFKQNHRQLECHIIFITPAVVMKVLVNWEAQNSSNTAKNK